MPLQSCPVHTIIELYIELIYGTWRVTYYVCRTSNKRADEDALGDIRTLQRTEESCNEIKLYYAVKVTYRDVFRYSNGWKFSVSYYDFDSTYCSNLWNKFLYTQFTHEYYSAFKAHLLEDVEKKLTNMIKI